MMATRTSLKQALFKLVSARGSPNIFDGPSFNTQGAETPFGQSVTLSKLAENKLVFCGEIHSRPPIVAFQQALQNEMLQTTDKLHVVMEHFSLDMDDLLQQYQKGEIDFEELKAKYSEIGSEGHDLDPYRPLLEDAKMNHEKIRLHAGFIPRQYSRILMKEGIDAVKEKTANTCWLPINISLQGTDFHYNIFESLITGRAFYDTDTPPTQSFRKIFKAQILKDVSMASKVNQLLDEDKTAKTDEKYLVIAGNGHLMNYCGVPERVLDENPDIHSQTSLVLSLSSASDFDDEDAWKQDIASMYGPQGSNPADYIYLYQDVDEMAKEETRAAYNKVGESAHLEGNSKKAQAIMTALGYTDEQFQIAGPDAYNYQGVGNPHKHAKIKAGDKVLDVGSGLGVDSFIAVAATGSSGQVLGVDLSSTQVEHARGRAVHREHTNVNFEVADMENLPLPDNSFDVIISNGAFCLAPNKEKAFAEVFRVLKPGGHISICTSTIQDVSLEPGVNWPSCMRLFVAKSEIKPMCEGLGFEQVVIDDSDSSMSMELPAEVMEGSNPDRNKVHVGSDEFQHLEGYDMDKLCARVVVVARKPAEKPSAKDSQTA